MAYREMVEGQMEYERFCSGNFGIGWKSVRRDICSTETAAARRRERRFTISTTTNCRV